MQEAGVGWVLLDGYCWSTRSVEPHWQFGFGDVERRATLESSGNKKRRSRLTNQPARLTRGEKAPAF
jgi:hypothetical protein